MKKLLWLAPLMALGCYKIDYINTGVPAQAGDPEMVWSHRAVFGLIEFEQTDVKDECPNGFAEIHTEVSVLNGLAQMILGNIYNPSTIALTCSAQPAGG